MEVGTEVRTKRVVDLSSCLLLLRCSLEFGDAVHVDDSYYLGCARLPTPKTALRLRDNAYVHRLYPQVLLGSDQIRQ